MAAKSSPRDVAGGAIALLLDYRLMCRPSRSKTIAVIGKRRVPLSLQNLEHRLLEKSVERSQDAKLSHLSSVRLLDLHTPYWSTLKRTFGGPEYVLRYLGRYTDRVTINHRLVSFVDGQVTFH